MGRPLSGFGGAAAIALALAIGLAPGLAHADPSTTAWVLFGTATETTSVSSGKTVSYSPIAAAANSTLLYISAEIADACFDPNTAGGAGSSRVTLKRALTAAGSDNAAIAIPALPVDGTDCVVLVAGLYWAQIDTAATGAETPILVVTGR